MKLLAGYVSRTVLMAMLLVLSLLLGLDLVFSFIAELEDLKGNYQALQALQVVLLELPFRLCDMLPVAGLIGGIVGLGLLAGQSELTVMRASGVSVGRIVWWVMRPALLVVVAGLAVAQLVVPVASQQADIVKARSLGYEYQSGGLHSFWHREGDVFIHMQTVRPDAHLQEVSFYRLNDAGQLVSVTLAGQGKPLPPGGWALSGIREVRIQPSDGSARLLQPADYDWKPELTAGFLRLVTVSPEFLPLTSLHGYAGYLESQGLEADAYYLEFWKKALAPFATLSMVLIACSFIFGPLRSVTMGLRIVSGVLTGLGFRYLQDIFGYASLVYEFSPLAAAVFPIALCLAGGFWALSRIR
jgi:lipopolysaccharide export system permease protein